MKWAYASHELDTRYEDDPDERPRMEVDKDSEDPGLDLKPMDIDKHKMHQW